MFYRDDQETIIRDTDQHGDAILTYVSHEDKLETYRYINSRLVNTIASEDLLIKYKNEQVHMVAEAMNRAPMYCNFLTSRGYNNILFVGHFDMAQYHWYLERDLLNPNTRMYDSFPPERSGDTYYPDINIILQFIPIFMKHWNYTPKVTIVRPPEPKYKGIIHHLYNLFRVSDNIVNSNKQYKHRVNHEFYLNDWDGVRFDAVVFAGVPMQNETQSFQLEEVKSRFEPYVTSNCQYVDIWNNQGLDNNMRFFRARRHVMDTAKDLGNVFSARSTWDKSNRNRGYAEELNFLKRQIKVFSTDPIRD